MPEVKKDKIWDHVYVPQNCVHFSESLDIDVWDRLIQDLQVYDVAIALFDLKYIAKNRKLIQKLVYIVK